LGDYSHVAHVAPAVDTSAISLIGVVLDGLAVLQV
jgi:hypothetical protein